MRFLAVPVLALTLVLGWAPTAVPSSSPGVERRDAIEAAVVRELNRVRLTYDLRPLRVAPSLRTAARRHTRAMLTHGFFSHDSVDGTGFSVRIRRHYTNRGWLTWTVGEALLASGARTVSAKEVVAAWMNSPSHREIILSPTWRDAGIGVLYAPIAPREFENAEAVVVTADFGLREGRAGLP